MCSTKKGMRQNTYRAQTTSYTQLQYTFTYTERVMTMYKCEWKEKKVMFMSVTNYQAICHVTDLWWLNAPFSRIDDFTFFLVLSILLPMHILGSTFRCVNFIFVSFCLGSAVAFGENRDGWKMDEGFTNERKKVFRCFQRPLYFLNTSARKYVLNRFSSKAF